MQYSPLDRDYLSKLENSVLAHSAEQYRAALRVLQEDPTPLSKPMVEYLERCLSMVTAEMAGRSSVVIDKTAPADGPMSAA